MELREDVVRLKNVAGKVSSFLRLAEVGLAPNHAEDDKQLQDDVIELTKRLNALIDKWRGQARSREVESC